MPGACCEISKFIHDFEVVKKNSLVSNQKTIFRPGCFKSFLSFIIIQIKNNEGNRNTIKSIFISFGLFLMLRSVSFALFSYYLWLAQCFLATLI